MVAVWLPPPQWLFENAPIQSHCFSSPQRAGRSPSGGGWRFLPGGVVPEAAVL